MNPLFYGQLGLLLLNSFSVLLLDIIHWTFLVSLELLLLDPVHNSVLQFFPCQWFENLFQFSLALSIIAITKSTYNQSIKINRFEFSLISSSALIVLSFFLLLNLKYLTISLYVCYNPSTILLKYFYISATISLKSPYNPLQFPLPFFLDNFMSL